MFILKDSSWQVKHISNSENGLKYNIIWIIQTYKDYISMHMIMKMFMLLENIWVKVLWRIRLNMVIWMIKLWSQFLNNY